MFNIRQNGSLSKGIDKGGLGGGGGGGGFTPSDFKLMLLWLPQKDIQNLVNNRGKTAEVINCVTYTKIKA